MKKDCVCCSKRVYFLFVLNVEIRWNHSRTCDSYYPQEIFITETYTLVSVNHVIRRYILSAFAPEIVKNSNFVKRLWIFSHPWERSISPVTIKGTRSRKKVCCVCGKSSDFTKTPLSHQIVHAQRIARKESIFLFFIALFVIFFPHHSTLKINHACILLSELQELFVCSSLCYGSFF